MNEQATTEVLPPEAEMSDEEILALLSQEPPTDPPLAPGERRPKWDKLTPGQQIALVADQNAIELTPEQRAEIERLENDEMAKQFMKTGFGKGAGLDELGARNIFSNMMVQKFDLPTLFLAMKYYNLRSCEKAVEYADQLIQDSHTAEWLKGADPDKRENLRQQALKIKIFAVKEMSTMLKRAQEMAQKLIPAAPQKPKRNLPPDVFNQQINVNVTVPSGEKRIPV